MKNYRKQLTDGKRISLSQEQHPYWLSKGEWSAWKPYTHTTKWTQKVVFIHIFKYTYINMVYMGIYQIHTHV